MTVGTVHAPIIHRSSPPRRGPRSTTSRAAAFALNLVMGWSAPEFEMFGITQRDHETRYQ